MLDGGVQARGFLAMVDEDLTKLSGQEERVLRLLFGIGEALHSREEVGRRLGMSKGWLRQVERRALRNLRQAAIGRDTLTETLAEPRDRLTAARAPRRS
jgi:DNA-directed RNA polymerase sigma subunit (sigma70/sigma32)